MVFITAEIGTNHVGSIDIALAGKIAKTQLQN